MKAFPNGIFAAVLTPFDENYRPDPAVAVPYYQSLLHRGLDGLNILGTTGEAMSVAVEDRLAFMKVLASQLPRERIMIGTGASALNDAVKLTSAVFELGFAAALVIPPFYYRDVPDAGVIRFYDALLRAVAPPARGILLYNFPRMSGITLNAGLVQELLADHGDAIGGIKESSDDLKFERTLHELFPHFAILPGSEEFLTRVLDEGFAGCISGSICLWPELAAEAWKNRDHAKAAELAEMRRQLQPPFIENVRARVARELRDELWLRAIPPLR